MTLFLANEGEPGFDKLTDAAEVNAFFDTHFADIVPLIPDLAETFLQNPTGILGTVRCKRWTDGEHFLLLGDAAHAIVPFHGQGMNAAFEDCRAFDIAIDQFGNDWPALFAAVENERVANSNAIADMALENYIEMRDSVNDPAFKLQKALSFELERRLPRHFVPRYSMVMFHDEIPYADAQARGEVQKRLLAELANNASTLDDIDMDAAVSRVVEVLQELP